MDLFSRFEKEAEQQHDYSDFANSHPCVERTNARIDFVDGFLDCEHNATNSWEFGQVHPISDRAVLVFVNVIPLFAGPVFHEPILAMFSAFVTHQIMPWLARRIERRSPFGVHDE